MSAARAPGSLRWRLLAGTLAWILATVALAGWGLGNLFRQHVAEQLRAELVLHLNQLTAAVNVAPDGALSVTPLSDPRLGQPLSGLYWQIDRLDDQGRTVMPGAARSRSLWDQTLALPDGAVDGAYDIAGPERHRLTTLTRTLKPEESESGALRLAVAADTAALAEPVGRFNHAADRVGRAGGGPDGRCGGAGAGGIASAGAAARAAGLAAWRRHHPIEGRFPSEIQPLVEDFNRVLAVNADMVQRARTQAGNLAHAVKTPLSILANAAAREDSPLAALVREQAALAQRQVDHHLARARGPRDRDARRCGRRWKPCCVSCAACMRSAGWMSTCRPFRRTWRFAAMNRTCRRWPAICWTTLANGRPGACASPRARRRRHVADPYR